MVTLRSGSWPVCSSVLSSLSGLPMVKVPAGMSTISRGTPPRSSVSTGLSLARLA
jgi:hypothetical protein